jgi:hypothetical protein
MTPNITLTQADAEAVWQAFLATDAAKSASTQDLLRSRLEIFSRAGVEYTIVRRDFMQRLKDSLRALPWELAQEVELSSEQSLAPSQ